MTSYFRNNKELESFLVGPLKKNYELKVITSVDEIKEKLVSIYSSYYADDLNPYDGVLKDFIKTFNELYPEEFKDVKFAFKIPSHEFYPDPSVWHPDNNEAYFKARIDFVMPYIQETLDQIDRAFKDKEIFLVELSGCRDYGNGIEVFEKNPDVKYLALYD